MNHPFKIGNVYENRNGLYEVVRIDVASGKMVVRFLGTGEESENTISHQARIWQNMRWDEQEATRRKAAEEARHQQGYGNDFSGLAASDFKTNTEGTTWRSRRGLAGQVARLLSANTPHVFVSWAVYRWPVAFLTHLETYQMAAYELGTRKAKFTIELDQENVYYGFYIERNAGSMDRVWDWLRWLPSLRDSLVLQDTVAAAEVVHGARFMGRVSSGEQKFHFADSLAKGARPLWDETSSSALSVRKRLHILENIPADQWIESYLIAVTPREEALRAGVHIAHTIASTMRTLLPIYTAAIQE